MARKVKRLRGKLKKWNDDRGFGFIRCQGRGDVFLHISDLPNDLERPPQVGDEVAFALGKGQDGRERAQKATLIRVRTTGVTVRPSAASDWGDRSTDKLRKKRTLQQLAIAISIVLVGGFFAARTIVDMLIQSSDRAAIATNTASPLPTPLPSASPSGEQTEPVEFEPMQAVPVEPVAVALPSAEAPVTSGTTGADCNIKGKISHESGSKLYHVPGMEDYEKTRIPRDGERWFCSEAEAQEAGWIRAPG